MVKMPRHIVFMKIVPNFFNVFCYPHAPFSCGSSKIMDTVLALQYVGYMGSIPTNKFVFSHPLKLLLFLIYQQLPYRLHMFAYKNCNHASWYEWSWLSKYYCDGPNKWHGSCFVYKEKEREGPLFVTTPRGLQQGFTFHLSLLTPQTRKSKMVWILHPSAELPTWCLLATGKHHNNIWIITLGLFTHWVMCVVFRDLIRLEWATNALQQTMSKQLFFFPTCRSCALWCNGVLGCFHLL